MNRSECFELILKRNGKLLGNFTRYEITLTAVLELTVEVGEEKIGENLAGTSVTSVHEVKEKIKRTEEWVCSRSN